MCCNVGNVMGVIPLVVLPSVLVIASVVEVFEVYELMLVGRRLC